MFLLIAILCFVTAVAKAQAPAMELPITIADNAGGNKILRCGLAAAATNGIDATLGESELPPFPPAGAFEARFIGDEIGLPQLGQGTYKDYRAGNADFKGTTQHEVRYQIGNGSTITISWELPNGFTGLLQDVITGTLIKQSMVGKGSYTVANPNAITKLKMTISWKGTTAVGQNEGALPKEFYLSQSFPNPFSVQRRGIFDTPATTIRFSLPQRSAVKLQIFDMVGKIVATLIDGTLAAGEHTAVFNARNLPSGQYLYQLQAGSFKQQRQLTLMK